MKKAYVISTVFIIVSGAYLFPSVYSARTCWDTGCQLDTWTVRGCQEYGMQEVGSTPCEGGTIYSCCDWDDENDRLHSNEAGYYGKRGNLTYYELGLTACGHYYFDSEMVAALAFNYFTTANPNHDPICGRKIKIVDPTSGKSVLVQVVDKCEGCKLDDIDVSPSAFEQLRPLSVGRFIVYWDFIDDEIP